MHDAQDADDVISDVNEELITDPIFNSIWPDLPIEEKDSIIAAATKIAKGIEDFKDKEIKENDEAYKKLVKNTKKELFNATDSDAALEAHMYLLSINGYDNLNDQNDALEKIAQLNAKPEDQDSITFRTTAEDDDGQTIYDLGEDDLNDELTYSSVLNAAKNNKLTKTSFLSWLTKVDEERNEALTFGRSQFKLDYGYTEKTDMNDDLGKVVQAAFMKASKQLGLYVDNNKEATYEQIVTKHEEILQEGAQIFKDILYSARKRSTFKFKDFLKSYDPTLDITKLTNQEIVDAANLANGASQIGQTEYDLLVEKFNYYELQEVDLK